jgi:hypothetical protein
MAKVYINNVLDGVNIDGNVSQVPIKDKVKRKYYKFYCENIPEYKENLAKYYRNKRLINKLQRLEQVKEQKINEIVEKYEQKINEIRLLCAM